MKITYYVATSKDGYIAREDGDVSWLDEMNVEVEDTGLEDFFADIDAIVMGRNSYDFVFDYGSWPYEDKPTWVCTSRELEPLEGAHLTVVPSIEQVIKDAEVRGVKHLWLVGGGKLASGFLDKGLLTHLSISEMPIMLDSGISLFANHKLEDLAVEDIQKIQKKGFTQMEITLDV